MDTIQDTYKDTKIGRIPKHWEVVKLGKLCETITKGTTPTTNGYSYLSEGINFVKVESIDSFGRFKNKMFAYIGKDCYESFKRSQLKEGDILISIAGALGRTAIVTNDILPANTNQAVGILRLKDKSLNTFIRYFLDSYFLQKFIERINVASAQANLNLGHLDKFNIVFPPIPEQQKIAEILSTVDEQISTTDKIIKKSKELKKGLKQKLFSEGIGHTEFKDTKIGRIPKDWEVNNLGGITNEITDYVAAGSFAALRENVTVYKEPKHALYVRLSDLRVGLGHSGQQFVDESSYKFLSKSNLFGGEILFANIGANVGEVVLMPFISEKATIAPNMIVIRAENENVVGKYLYYYLGSYPGKKEILKIIAGGAQPKINKTELRAMKCPFPPIPEQQKIASILSEADAKIEREESQKEYLEKLKKGLMQQLLTGKKRVKV